jgi:hypothetical protein
LIPYARGKLIGDVTISQLSVGLQAGGESYSQMIFFEKKESLDEFTSGNFEFGGNVGAIAITASASANAGTAGASAAASGGKKDAAAAGEYHDGMVVFTVAKGGLRGDERGPGGRAPPPIPHDPRHGRGDDHRDGAKGH